MLCLVKVVFNVSCSTCECASWRSMKLPCRHIFAVREKLEVDPFETALCDERWSSSYYTDSRRIFVMMCMRTAQVLKWYNFLSQKGGFCTIRQTCYTACYYMPCSLKSSIKFPKCQQS